MSRAYRISVSQTVQKHIHVSDGLRTQLELLGVLPGDEMCELLVVELGRRGFEHRDGCMVRVDEDGVEITVGVANGDDSEPAGNVTVRLALDQDLELTAERSRTAYEENADIERERLQQSVERALERKERHERQQLSDKVTEVLERKLRDLRAELASISNRVTADALKIRAAQLGEIRELSEDPETGSLTIKVRV